MLLLLREISLLGRDYDNVSDERKIELSNFDPCSSTDDVGTEGT